MGTNTSLRKISGSALLTALFIMTIVAIAATAMSKRLQLDIYRAQTAIASDELYLASEAVTFWAMGQISTQEKKPYLLKNEPGLILTFPAKFKNLYPGVTLDGKLYDLQAHFNVNNLINPQQRLMMKRLLLNLKVTPPIPSDSQQNLLNAIISWISPQLLDKGRDPFLETYAKHDPSYLPAYQPMQDISELRMVAGFTPAIYEALLPDVTALPNSTPVNVMTAPKEVLMALGGAKAPDVNEFITARKMFHEAQNRNAIAPLLERLNIQAHDITLFSNYFLTVGIAKNNHSTLIHYSVLSRQVKRDGKKTVRILSEWFVSQ